jgi:deoxyribose-phosphate aldolase
MNRSELASFIDHTLLKPDATPDDIIRLCGEARKYGFFTVCVNSCYVPAVCRELSGSSVSVCSVVGFPLGACAPAAKAFEAAEAVRCGAAELDIVINVGFLKGGLLQLVKSDLDQTILCARKENPATVIKIILETCLLTHGEKIIACTLALDAGANFVKTSTGFSRGGATVNDVVLLKKIAGNKAGVKASGGIRDLSAALYMIKAGASRIGTSSGPAIIEELNR